ncbi:hypothetical protein FS749_010283 [Ceratobasidium sp. UAMH 11750]|nr:hypothetical protein FS749_010283 [Ceratobasidium sp. UAMH 11750]
MEATGTSVLGWGTTVDAPALPRTGPLTFSPASPRARRLTSRLPCSLLVPTHPASSPALSISARHVSYPLPPLHAAALSIALARTHSPTFTAPLRNLPTDAGALAAERGAPLSLLATTLDPTPPAPFTTS